MKLVYELDKRFSYILEDRNNHMIKDVQLTVRKEYLQEWLSKNVPVGNHSHLSLYYIVEKFVKEHVTIC